MSGMTSTSAWIQGVLERRLSAAGRDFLAGARAEIAAGCDEVRFAGLISLSSRHVPALPLAITVEESAAAAAALPGWNPERWNLRETARVDLVLARSSLPGFERALEGAFPYADLGEGCALYKSLALLPDPARFAHRAAEGARSNIRALFESTVCDTPYPARWFDAVAWRQCVIKALFVEAPLWRVHGLDARLDAELARMALDLALERHSAGRPVNPQLWMVLGPHAQERGLQALEREFGAGTQAGRACAALAFGRLDAAAKARARLPEKAERERDPVVQAALREALRGAVTQHSFRAFDGPVPKVV
jgi:hypothetical protein